MTLRALIFDVDGTLADTEEAHRAAFNEAFERDGLGWHWSKPLYAQLLRTTGGKERLASYIHSLDLRPVERDALLVRVPAIHQAKTQAYTRMVADGSIRLREGVARLMDEAAHSRIQLAVASTTSHSNIVALISSTLGPMAMQRFAAVGCGDEVMRKKPAPDVYDKVLRDLRASPEHCVAIEDSALGLAAAKAADLFTIVTPSDWTAREDFSTADLVVPSLGTVRLEDIRDRLAASSLALRT